MVAQVVVLAYGPGFQIHGAVRRAVDLAGPGGRVWVVPALPTAREGVDLLASDPPDGVVVVAGEGSAALRSALEDLGDVPTLLLHDDVELDADAVAALEAAHRATGTTVVPFTSDRDCDHAVALLDAPDAPDAPFAVRHVRPSCVLGLPDDLYALSARALVDPRVRLEDVSWGFHAVPAAVAVHAGRCATRLLGPEGPDGRPLLVAHVIVRDEEATLPGLLASIEGLVDRVEVCDTGSTDRTVEIAEAAGCHVIHREWRDDFSWARNEVLDQARDAWYVLMVDADDRLHCDDTVLLRRQLATFLHEIEAYKLPVRSRVGMDTDEVYGSEMLSIRIFRPDRTHWTGRLHELPCRVGTGDVLVAIPLESPWVEHIGYTAEVLVGRDKAARNISISRAVYEEEGGGKAALEYARSLMLSEADPAEQLVLLEEVVAASTNAGPATRAYVLATTAGVHAQLGHHEEALALADEALTLVPADDIAARHYAEACEVLGRGDELVARAEALAGLPSLHASFANAHGRAVWHARLSAALAAQGRIEEAAGEAAEVLLAAPIWFDRWEPLIDAAATVDLDRSAAVLIPLLGGDDTGTGIAVVGQRFAPAATAELCAAIVVTGATARIPTAVLTTGVLAALVADRNEALVVLLDACSDLDPAWRAELATRAEARGRHDVAAVLRAAAPA